MAEMLWTADDGIRHNFSHASWNHSSGLFVAAAPFAELADGETDIGSRMMSLTSWLDLICKVKVKHVVCLLDDEELYRPYSDGLGEGGLAATCRGQGLSFHHTPLHDGWPSAAALADALAALRRLPRPFLEEGVVLVCQDGIHVAAGVAASWLALEHDVEPSDAVRAVEAAGKEVGARRDVLKPFEAAAPADSPNPNAAFAALLAGGRELLPAWDSLSAMSAAAAANKSAEACGEES